MLVVLPAQPVTAASGEFYRAGHPPAAKAAPPVIADAPHAAAGAVRRAPR
jgi:hypothetical protein